MFKKIRFIVVMLLLALLTLETFAQDSSAEAELFDEVIQAYGLIAVDSVPDGIVPQQVNNSSEIINTIGIFEAQAIVRETAFESHSDIGLVPLDIISRANNYHQYSTTKNCSTAVGASTYNGYANVTIGVWNGVYSAYQSLNNYWWSHTGVTYGLTITNVSQDYYLTTPAPSTQITMRNNFTINYYTVVPWGQIYLYSNDSYVHCYMPA